MVESLSYSKAKELSSVSDVSDLAACMAAVSAYIQLEEEEELAAQSRASGGDAAPSPWESAALLEGTQAGAFYDYPCYDKHRMPLWRNFFAIAAAAAALIVSGAAPSQADDTTYGDPYQVTAALPAKPARARTSAPTIKVALAIGVPEISVDALDGAQLLDMSTGRTVALLSPLSQWRLAARSANGAAALALSGRREIDRQLIASGAQLAQLNAPAQKNVAFFPRQASPSLTAPPAIKTLLQQTPQNSAARAPLLTISCPLNPASPPAATAATTMLEAGYDEELSEIDNLVPPAQQSLSANGITHGIIIGPDRHNNNNSQYVFSLNGRMYRGSLWIKPIVVKDKSGNSVTRFNAINVLDLEDYLMSVLPSEMPSAWPAEALKAQAIAARSYAMANLGKYGSQGFDVKATVLDQAYRGAGAETVATNKAVAETRGIVMKHQGKVVPGFFHSTSAGHTDVAEHVWTKEVPYLKSVPDLDHKSKYVLWERKFSINQIDNLLGNNVGTVLGLFPVHRSPAGRVKDLLVTGSRGCTLVSGVTVRELFSLPSTNFNVLAYQDSYLFKGQGFGHGLGMSQYGARSLADHGYNAAQILTYYYKDVTFEHIVETPAL